MHLLAVQLTLLRAINVICYRWEVIKAFLLSMQQISLHWFLLHDSTLAADAEAQRLSKIFSLFCAFIQLVVQILTSCWWRKCDHLLYWHYATVSLTMPIIFWWMTTQHRIKAIYHLGGIWQILYVA